MKYVGTNLAALDCLLAVFGFRRVVTFSK